MSKAIILLAATCLATSPALATDYTMDLVPEPTQASRMDSGVESVDSYAALSAVRIVQTTDPVKKRGVVQLLVLNSGNVPFNFGPENVTAALSDGTPVAIVPYAELVRQEKGKQTWRRIAAGLAAAGNNMNAANAGQTNGTVHSGYGSASYSANNSGLAYAAQAQANRDNRQMMENVASNHEARLMNLRENLQTTTVDPSKVFGGVLTFELPKQVRNSKPAFPVTFKVQAGAEEHTFSAMLIPD